MATSEEEGIFQINDYTTVTEFEELTNNIELYIRGSGFSVDIRQQARPHVTHKFSFHGFDFSCFHTVCRNAGKAECRQPLEEVMQEERGYPLLGPPLSQLFGFTEFLVVKGKIPEKEEGTVLSAFTVGAHSAKCLLPVFLLRAERSGTTAIQATGILAFPGYYATFEVWNISKRQLKEEKPLFSFLPQHICPTSSFRKASACTAHRLAKYAPSARSPQHFDLLKEILVYCKWQARPADLLAAYIPGQALDPATCDAMRIQLVLDAERQYASGYFCQLEQRNRELCGEVSEEALRRNTPEAVYFDEFLMELSSIFPIYPINSLWTKAAIDLLISSRFSISSLQSFLQTLRRRGESGQLSLDLQNDFKQFSHCSDLHQYLLTLTGAMQCARFIHTNEAGDPSSRVVFLHLSPAHRQELQLIDPSSLPEFCKSLVKRVLKALLVDEYMRQGRGLEVAEFIQWHKTALRTYGTYAVLCKDIDDGQAIALWEAISAESFTDTRLFVINELIKEMEIAAQQLEGLTTSELEEQMAGLCLSAILALIFSQQVAFLSDSRTDSLLIPAVKERIRPFFREFQQTCEELPSLCSLDSVVVSELSSALRRLETCICTAFSLTVKLPAASSLTTQLLRATELEIACEADRKEALAFLQALSPADLWKTLVVLKSANCRFTCSTEGKEGKMAIARVEKECPDSDSKPQ